jgi:SAM-dependent methyltransferase
VERSEYAKLAEVEDAMWWFQGVHANLIAAHRRAAAAGPASHRQGPLLDAGCGTGGFLAKLARDLPAATIVGIEHDAEACRLARRKSGVPIAAGSVDALPFADGALTAIFSADVLCHRNVDEAATLRDFHRCLAGQGQLVLNLPAYQWLLSAHDRAVHNARRYTGRRIRDLLQRAGFTAVRTSYWNTILFPLMVLRRLVGRQGSSDVAPFPAAIEGAFRAAMRLEGALLRRGVVLPYGGSILATAVKP